MNTFKKSRRSRWDGHAPLMARLNVVCTEEEKAAWRAAAAREGKDFSAWVREELTRRAKRALRSCDIG